jgi:hypothetical protein
LNPFKVPGSSHDIKIYVYAELFLPTGEQTWQSQARQVSLTLADKVPSGDVLWNEKFHWDFVEDDIAFIRYLHFSPGDDVLTAKTKVVDLSRGVG